MPSEPQLKTPDRAAGARQALQPARDRYRSILAATVEQVRVLLRNANANGAGAPEPVDMIDLSRFNALKPAPRAQDASVGEPIAHAFDVLTDLLSAGYAAFEVEVDADRSLRETVDARLTSLGRAFGAARVIELAQAGRYDDEEHAGLLQGLAFEHWNAAEREVAPPLVVHVSGDKLLAVALADYLDGNVQMVLVARGDAPLAPLAPLITPHRLVVQAVEPDALAPVGRHKGPAIAALLPDSCARFVHDPAAGGSYFERLVVEALPDVAQPRAIGQTSAAAQVDALAHLAALTSVTVESAPDAEIAPQDAEARLAAWLLKQARM
jgi:hypothetical protein